MIPHLLLHLLLLMSNLLLHLLLMIQHLLLHLLLVIPYLPLHLLLLLLINLLKSTFPLIYLLSLLSHHLMSLPTAAVNPADPPITTYTIVGNGTNNRKCKLSDSNGYSYCKKKTTKTGVTWWNCSVHNNNTYCKALVKQQGDSFQPAGRENHTCSKKPNEEVAVKIKRKIIDSATSQIFTSATEIVTEVLQQDLPEVHIHSLTTPLNLIRAANHHQQAMCPKEPTNLDIHSSQFPSQ